LAPQRDRPITLSNNPVAHWRRQSPPRRDLMADGVVILQTSPVSTRPVWGSIVSLCASREKGFAKSAVGSKIDLENDWLHIMNTTCDWQEAIFTLIALKSPLTANDACTPSRSADRCFIYPLLNLIRNQIIYLIGRYIIRSRVKCRRGICCRTIDFAPRRMLLCLARDVTKPDIFDAAPFGAVHYGFAPPDAAMLSFLRPPPFPQVDLTAQARRESETRPDALTSRAGSPRPWALRSSPRTAARLTPSIILTSRGCLEQGRSRQRWKASASNCSAGRWPFQGPSCADILAPTARSG